MRLSAILGVFLILAGQPAVAANAPPATSPSTAGMLAHRAMYKLTLDKANSHDVIAAHGTMGYEVTDVCDGWAVRQRLDMAITNADGQEIDMSSDYATWESKDGRRFRFHMRQTTDTAVTSQTDGEASLVRVGGPGTAHYTAPHNITVALPPGTVFPMAHTAAIIAAAQQKKRFLNLPLFDGTDENGAEDSFIIVMDWKPAMAVKWEALRKLPSTRVHISFFDRNPVALTPTYETTMRYWENGVADDLRMDFGDFIMSGHLQEFSPQPKRC